MRTISRPRPPPYWASSAGLTDILSAFTVHFDIKISTSELRGADTRGIRLCWVLLRVQGTIKMLGVTFGICGTHDHSGVDHEFPPSEDLRHDVVCEGGLTVPSSRRPSDPLQGQHKQCSSPPGQPMIFPHQTPAYRLLGDHLR